MKKIKLSKNKFALVDDSDFAWLSQWSWCVSTKGYAVRKQNGHNVTMHRLINNTPEEFQTDHINRNKLDNRRSNLRTVTNSQNHFNIGLQVNNNSGCAGVYFDKQTKKWRVFIQVNNKRISLGRFFDLKKAISVRQIAERKYHTINA